MAEILLLKNTILFRLQLKDLYFDDHLYKFFQLYDYKQLAHLKYHVDLQLIVLQKNMVLNNIEKE